MAAPAVGGEAVARPASFVWPATTALATKLALPLGFLLTPAATLVEGSPVLHRGCVRCDQCNGVVNPYTSVQLGTGVWRCMLCGANNAHPNDFADTNIETYPELASKVIEYVEPFAQMAAPITNNFFSASLVFVLDENIGAADATNLQSSIVQLLAGLPRAAVITLITFSNTVSVYNLQAKDAASATVFPGSKHMSDSSKAWIKANLVNIAVTLDFCNDCVTNAVGVFGNLRRRSRVLKGQPSALGTALEFADAVLTSQYPEATAPPRRKELDHRIIVVTSTAPHLGPSPLSPAAVAAPSATAQFDPLQSSVAAFYKRVGQQLVSIGATIDIFCLGHAQLGLKLLSQLTQPCAGRIFTYSDCGEQMTADLIVSVWENRWLDCTLTLRYPTSVGLTRVIGPAVELATADKTPAYQAPWNFDLSKERGVQFRVPSLSPRDCLAAYMELTDAVEAALSESGPAPSVVTVQAEAHYTNRTNDRVVRIVTFQVRVSSDEPTVLAAIDGDVTAVLLARMAVLQAKTAQSSEQAQAAVDKALAALLKSVGEPTRDLPFYKLPLSLQDLPHRMFHLRRGPLLGTLLQHPDDIALAQAKFLSLPMDASLRQITPTLLTFYVDPQDMTPHALQLSLVNLVMRSNRVLLLDDETTVIVWFGSETGAPQYEVIRTFALAYAVQLAQTRFPRPTIRTLQEGTSMARFLLCRLAPLHKEDRHSQEMQLPELASLAIDDRQRLMSQFHRTDEQSFGEYCRYLRQFDQRR